MAENIVVRAQPHLERARIGLGRTINRTIDGSTQGTMETEGDEFSMSNNSHVGGWRNRRPPPQTNANFGIGTMSLTTTSLTVSATGIPDTVAASLTTPWEKANNDVTPCQLTNSGDERFGRTHIARTSAGETFQEASTRTTALPSRSGNRGAGVAPR